MAAIQSIIEELGGNIIPVLAIVLGIFVALFAITGGLFIEFVKIVRGGGRKKATPELDAEETEAFQELHRGFQRMDERVEALETLMMERSAERRPATRIEN